jgi:hypothetical protein
MIHDSMNFRYLAIITNNLQIRCPGPYHSGKGEAPITDNGQGSYNGLYLEDPYILKAYIYGRHR